MSSLYIRLISNIIKNHNINGKLLDVGCGDCAIVKELIDIGFDAYGADVEFKGDFHLKKDIFHKIFRIGDGKMNRENILDQNSNYNWNVNNNKFNLIISKATIEHIKNLDEFSRENYTALCHNGISMHYFPSMFSIIEPHTGIPFGGILQFKFYYLLCCKLRICFKRYSNKHLEAYNYVKKYTFYKSSNHIKNIFLKAGFRKVYFSNNMILKEHGNIFFKVLSSFKIFCFCFGLFRSMLLILHK